MTVALPINCGVTPVPGTQALISMLSLANYPAIPKATLTETSVSGGSERVLSLSNLKSTCGKFIPPAVFVSVHTMIPEENLCAYP